MRANAWEGIGKELKIKRKFYVISRDVRMVCPRLKTRTVIRKVICLFNSLLFVHFDLPVLR
jgi:hypothetical protein